MAAEDYVENVVNSIICQLENGTAPWIKPWKPGERFMPYNPSTGNEYHGMNSIWLLSVSEERGYGDNRWLTYKQASSVDAQVNRGEKGTHVQYWKWTEDVPAVDESGQPLRDETGKPLRQSVRLQKPKVWSATVFNAAQISGLPEIERPVLPEVERHQQAEAILNDSRANIIYRQGDRAFYRPSDDTITLPERTQFHSMDGFYATALHELGHWTGHASRLNRDLVHPFGSIGYAKEELRAEMASLMLGEQLSIGHDPGQHVAYIATWIKLLEDDPRELFRAAGDAERITRYLQSREMLQEKNMQQNSTKQEQVPVVVAAMDVAQRSDSERIYLNVPYAEKNAAKAAGAKWDRAAKSWYVPNGVSIEPFKQWMESKQALHIETTQAPEVEFAEALRAAGLVLTEPPIMDGNLHRVPVEGDDHSQKSGAYVGFLDGHPAGYVNNYKTGYQQNWKSSQRQQAISTEERAKLEAEAQQRQAEQAKQRDIIQAATAEAVAAVWLASEETQSHPYLEDKGVHAYGLRTNTIGSIELTGGRADDKPQQWSDKGQMLVPIQDVDGRFLGAQSIDDDGRKSFPRGSRLYGGHHVIGSVEPADKVLIAEGYATAATLYQATGLPVVVAFHSGNLSAVAQAYREKFQDKILILAGDNDHSKPIEKNTGRQKAEEAARQVGGYVLLPEFEKGAPGSDWNDVAKFKGPDKLKFELTVGLKNIDRQIMAANLAQDAKTHEQEEEKQIARRFAAKSELAQSRGGITLSI